jgi:hypothetical protein
MVRIRKVLGSILDPESGYVEIPGEIPQYRHADGLTALKQVTTPSASICYNPSFKIIPPFNISIILAVEK